MFSISCLSYHALGQNTDTIKWSNKRQLTFDDFLAPIDTSSPFRAISHVNYKFKYDIKNDTIYFVSFSTFVKSRSRFNIINKKSFCKSDIILLKHEQGHFNILEIELRKLKNRIVNVKFDKGSYKLRIRKLINDFDLGEEITQKLYDKETDLSRNEKKQEEWNKKIAQQLKDLDMYSLDTIKVPLQK